MTAKKDGDGSKIDHETAGVNLADSTIQSSITRQQRLEAMVFFYIIQGMKGGHTFEVQGGDKNCDSSGEVGVHCASQQTVEHESTTSREVGSGVELLGDFRRPGNVNQSYA